MDNTNQSSVKTKNITLGFVIAWIFGLLALVSGLISLFSKPLAGILYLLISAIVFPPFVKLLQSKINFSLSRSLKIIIVIILLFIAGSLISKDNDKLSGNDVSIKESSVVAPQEIIKISALELYNEYKANQVSADTKFKGKAVELNGTINSIGKDILDNPFISFVIQQYQITTVQCMFSKKDETALASLSKGQRIVVQGKVLSGTLGNIIVNDCKVINN